MNQETKRVTQHNRSQFEKYGRKNIFKHIEMLFYSVEKKKSKKERVIEENINTIFV